MIYAFVGMIMVVLHPEERATMSWYKELLQKPIGIFLTFCLTMLLVSSEVLGGVLEFDYQSECSAVTGLADLLIIPAGADLYEVSLDDGLSYQAAGDYSFTINVLSNSSIEVKIRASDGCESLSELIQFIIPPNPTGSILQQGCADSGGLIFVENPGDNYHVEWFAAATGSEPAAGNPTEILNGSIFEPNTTGTYFAQIVHNVSGCSSAERLGIEFSLLPPVELEIYGFECDPQGFVTYMLNGVGGSGSDYTLSTSFEWVKTDEYFLIEGVTGGSTPTVSIQDGNGCSTGSFVLPAELCFCSDLVVNTPSASETLVSYCPGDPIPSLSVDLPPSTQGIRWYADSIGYQPAEGLLSGAFSEQFQPESEGTYYVTYYDSINGCASPERLAIQVEELDELEVFQGASTCSADLQTYTVELEVEGGLSDYTVTATGYTVAGSGGEYSVAGIPAGVAITVQVVDAINCTTDDFVVEPIDCSCSQYSIPDFTSDQTSFILCEGEAIPTLSVSVDSPDYTVFWYEDNNATVPALGQTSGLNQEAFLPNELGNYYATIVHTASGCETFEWLSFSVQSLAPLTVLEGSADCSNTLENYEINFSVEGGSGSMFSIDAGAFVLQEIGGMYSIANVPSGTPITISIEDEFGCQLNNVVLSTIECSCNSLTIEKPIPMEEAIVICAEQETITIAVQDPGDGFIVEWYMDVDLLLPASGLTAGNHGEIITVPAADVYFAALRDLASGCLGPSNAGIMVEPVSPITATASNFECTGDLSSFEVYFEIAGGMGGPYTVVSPNGPVMSVGEGFLMSAVPEGSFIELTAVDAMSCSITNLTLNTYICDCDPTDLPFVQGQKEYLICEGEELPMLSMLDPGEEYTIRWFDSEEAAEPIAIGLDFQALSMNSYYADLVHLSSACASYSKTEITIDVLTPIVVEEMAHTCQQNGLAYDLEISVSGGLGAGYLLDAGSFETDKSAEGTYIIRNIPSDVSADLLVGDPIGCLSDYQSFEAYHCELPPPPNALLMPTAFSPNNDGMNDSFKIAGNNIVDAQIAIYNRWGEPVFLGSHGSEGWTGLYDGQPAEVGVYTYFVEVQYDDGQTDLIPGNIVLLR